MKHTLSAGGRMAVSAEPAGSSEIATAMQVTGSDRDVPGKAA